MLNPLPYRFRRIANLISTQASSDYQSSSCFAPHCMSRQHVKHYMRFKDQMEAGADSQKRHRLVAEKG